MKDFFVAVGLAITVAVYTDAHGTLPVLDLFAKNEVELLFELNP